MTGPAVPAGPPWAAAVDRALLRRLLGRRPVPSLPTRRGLDRSSMGERRVPVSLRLATRARLIEDEPGEPLPVVRPAGPLPAVGARAAVVRPRPAPPAGRQPPAAPLSPAATTGPVEVGRPLRPTHAGHLRVVPTAGPPSPGTAAGSGVRTVHEPGPGTDGRIATGASLGTAPAPTGDPSRPAGGAPQAGARVRPVRRAVAPALPARIRVRGSADDAAALPPRPVVRPRPRPSAVGSDPGPARPPAPAPRARVRMPAPGTPSASPGQRSAPAGGVPPVAVPARAGGAPSGWSPAAPPPDSAGAPVQRLAAPDPPAAAAPPAVDEVVDQVLRRLGREFAVSAERRGLRSGERPGELGR